MQYNLGELFCGPGGLACGALCADIANSDFKITHKWATDYDADTCKTYIRNICPENPESVLCAGIRTEGVIEKLLALGNINAFAFGFPCNDFSVVGEQKGFDGKFGSLYQYGIEILNRCNPDCFLAENVGGLKTANDGKAINTIFDAMRGAGERGYRIYQNLYKFEMEKSVA